MVQALLGWAELRRSGREGDRTGFFERAYPLSITRPCYRLHDREPGGYEAACSASRTDPGFGAVRSAENTHSAARAVVGRSHSFRRTPNDVLRMMKRPGEFCCASWRIPAPLKTH